MTADPGTDDGISIYVAAHDVDDARALFDKCLELAATGEHFDGRLVHVVGGFAQLYTHLYSPPKTTKGSE